GLLKPEDGREYEIYKKQCLKGGAMISFEIVGGEKEAFLFLNRLNLINLAVSLGGTESLAEHPATMTHVDMQEALVKANITENLIRISIGVEHHKDLIHDMEQAFDAVKNEMNNGKHETLEEINLA
ncbi:MAG: PLP-dependent transferase, partial [Cyclobacteriaceae bacterium]|nr:PLP-dependent transferase [Cyclobacteriaceae bacterium]